MGLVFYFSVWMQGLETELASARPNAGIKEDKLLVDVLQGKLHYMISCFESSEHSYLILMCINSSAFSFRFQMNLVLESVAFLFMIKLAQQSPKTAVISGIRIIQTHTPIREHSISKLSNVVKVCKNFLHLNLQIFQINLL